MSETVALIRLSLASSRWLLACMIAVSAIGLATALYAGALYPQGSGNTAIPVLLLSMLPAAVAAIALFDYGQGGDMNLPESGCSHWLLRMPIESWKIALVPVILKTLWISLLWSLFVAVSRNLGIQKGIPLLAPCIGFSAAAIWILVIAWRPFRSGWRRLAALSMALPLLYCSLLAVLAAPHIDEVDWRPASVLASTVLAITLYGAGVWAAIRSVKLARVCSHGIVPQAGVRFTKAAASTESTSGRRFKSAERALVYYDLLASRWWTQRLIIALVIPTVVACALLLPFSGPALTIVLIVFSYYGTIAICRTSGPLDSLPTHLAVSPLSNLAIARARLSVSLAIAALVYGFVFFVLAAWLCRSEYREIWQRWAANLAASLGGGAAPFPTGLRWSVAILLSCPVFVLGRIASHAWIGMSGRRWIVFAATWIESLLLLSCLAVVLAWFLRQTDWESTEASARVYLAYLPNVVISLLILKFISAATSAIVSLKLGSCTGGGLVHAGGVWTAVMISVAVSMWLLIPDRRVTLLWCLAATSLAIPLSRIMILPVVVAWNRHR